MDELEQDDFKGDLAHPKNFPGNQNFQCAAAMDSDLRGQRHVQRDLFGQKGLQKKILNLTWPLHFIDFETTAPAIPFYKGYALTKG